jgi:2-keto-4-pentenoate hydratase
LAPALKIVDYRLAAPKPEAIAESSSFHFGLVLGAPRAGSVAPPIGPGCPALLHNGRLSATPDPGPVPADLAQVVRFVAHFLGAHGQALRAGDLILSGACTNAVRVQPGDGVRADFGPLGSVEVRFIAS